MRGELRAQRRQMRRQLREHKRALKQQLRAKRQALRAAGAAKRRKRRLIFWALVALILLILLLLQDCQCNEPLAPEPPEVGEVEPHQDSAEPEADAPRKPATGRLPRVRRPDFDNEPLDPLPWLAEYRLQVAARSSRLAECFVGAPNPGTLEWTASVEPLVGHVSDHVLEPMLQSDALTRHQKFCALDVLSYPPYDLDSDQERSTPARVRMVIEF